MKIIECPRDAMQGLTEFIPTKKKIAYINKLLKVGFDTIDFGSFVSPKVMPQMSDTVEVLSELDIKNSKSKLLAIVANTRGAEQASQYASITYLGFPLSISETFQLRNTNKSIAEALQSLKEIQQIGKQSEKEMVTYISMGFGNPYNDIYDINIVEKMVEVLAQMEIKIISLSDTIGKSTPKQIESLLGILLKKFPSLECGVHLHSSPSTTMEKIEAAYRSGCQRFDGAIKGYGGCPMAEDQLVGNVATETILSYLKSKDDIGSINKQEFAEAVQMADTIFPNQLCV